MAKKQPASEQVQLELFTPMTNLYADPSFDAALYQDFDAALGKDKTVHMVRIASFTTDRFFNELQAAEQRVEGKLPPNIPVDIDGIRMDVSLRRIGAFKTHGVKCVQCGLEGKAFFVERHVNERPSNLHINLYGIRSNGFLAMLTVDHILPHSMGGKYSVSNFQPMCSTCNSAKRNLMSQDEINRVRANPELYVKDWYDRDYLELMLSLQERLLKHHKKGDKYPAANNPWYQLFDKYRTKMKADTKATKVVELLGAIRQAVADLEAKEKKCNTNVLPAKVAVSTVDSWSKKIKRWFASTVKDLGSILRGPFRSKPAS